MSALAIPHHARHALADRLEGAWYGYAPGERARALAPQTGRRRYTAHALVAHGSPHQDRRPLPPEHEAGRERLRAILTTWRSEWGLVAAWDLSRGGDVRRCIATAGIALKAETDDGRERADALVLRAAAAIRHADGPGTCDAFAARLAKRPVAPFRWEYAGMQAGSEVFQP